MSEIQVKKRSGDLAPLDYNKIHFMLEEATKGLSGVSISDVEMDASLKFYDGIPTAEIHENLVKAAVDLITEKTPNYEILAARLVNYGLRKEVFGEYTTIPLKDVIQLNVDRGVYDDVVLKNYSADEIEQLNKVIDHDRDYLFKFAGIQQCVDKYLLSDRISKQRFETPQYMYMMIAMTLFSRYKELYSAEERLDYVRRYYDAISTFRLNLPTPVLCGARTPLRQYSSCVLVDFDDDMDSIIHSDSIVKKYTSQRAGLGINMGRIRSIGSEIRGGEVIHTGVIPFLKCAETSVRCCTQNGVRGGSATVHFPFWHTEIEDIIVLKNNRGTDENRVRKLDYSIQLNETFYQRVLSNTELTLFSPHEVPELYDTMGDPELFAAAYEKAEKEHPFAKRVNARRFFTDLINERIETGRIYIMNIDHCNTHSSFTLPIRMSNLCQEITLPTKPVRSYDDVDGEVALCILSALNLGQLDLSNLHNDMAELCDLAVRGLDEIVDLQEYPIAAATNSTRKRRSLGVGFIGLAHFLAMNKIHYNSQDAIDTMHRVTESFQYHLIQASVDLAKVKGKCDGFSETKYGQGILPIDTYKKAVDDICSVGLELDWELLRSNVLEYGVRNSTLSAQMPSESSSVTSNETNGIELPRSAVTTKKSKQGVLKMVLPEYRKYKEFYTMVWDDDYDNMQYIKVGAVIQKFFDQAISMNDYWNPFKYNDNKLPVKDVMRLLVTAYKLGQKTSYYLNTYDGKAEVDIDEQTPEESDCAGGACAI